MAMRSEHAPSTPTGLQARRGTGGGSAEWDAHGGRESDDFEEISLVDIARVLHKRRFVLIATIVLSLVTGGLVTAFTTPVFESSAEVIPLSHEQIFRNWLESRQAAAFAVDQVGEELYPVLFPDQWDAAAGAWSGAAPSDGEIARALRAHVTVTGATDPRQGESVLTATVALTDAAVARDVAQAYLDSLQELRPQLEEITRSELFDKYYDGSNAQEAQARAETAAKEKQYWIAFDEPVVPDDPVKPRPVLNMALAGVLGVMLGVFLVFGLEWLGQFRAEFERVEPPPQ